MNVKIIIHPERFNMESSRPLIRFDEIKENAHLFNTVYRVSLQQLNQILFTGNNRFKYGLRKGNHLKSLAYSLRQIIHVKTLF